MLIQASVAVCEPRVVVLRDPPILPNFSPNHASLAREDNLRPVRLYASYSQVW